MIDNIYQTFIDNLKNNILQNSNVHIQCNQITFLAIAELIKEVEGFNKIQVLIGNEKNTVSSFGNLEADFQLRSDLQSILKAQKLLSYSEKKIEFKNGFFGVNSVIIENDQEVKAFIYTHETLNSQILGLTPSQFPTIVTELAKEQSYSYLQLFKTAYHQAEPIKKIEDLVTLNIDQAIPKSQYLYSLRHLFDDYERIENYENLERTGFFSSKIWSLLYNFQKDAVLGAIDKIEKYGGCIIADSVGLGKTFEALGVIKYYENKNKNVLVLSPKRLFENWNVYRNSLDRRNILAEDRLNYDLLFHTDLSRYKGESNGIDLENYYWENVDLIVIDESHNFRNNNPSKNRITRYERLMQDIIKKGVKTKVLMLSATPVNNKLKDLKNQLYFITEEDDQGLAHAGISSINQVLRKTQKEFNDWLSKLERTREELINELDGRYFKLLDMLTIARSRKHIQKYYDTADIGQFPNRLAPINLHPDFDTKDQFPDIGFINNEILRLNMAQYNPTKYIMPNKRELYSQKYDYQLKGGSVFRQEAREESLIGLMRVNFLKRLESSIYSYRTTMNRVQENIKNLIEQIDMFHESGYSSNDFSILDDFDVDTIDPEQFIGENVKVLLQDMDLIRFKQDLQYDLQVIQSILTAANEIDVARDKKLQTLKDEIRKKVTQPINENNKKVLVFSAFADTATYLYENIAKWAQEELGIYTGLVTGGSANNKTNLPACTNEFNNIIVNFSPKSKLRASKENALEKEIDILIGTDCISEGQNLQDCDYLINYDIHWNPVRIVQRFGRIDRIGSTNTDIQLVNFWPNVDLNAYIDLIERVKGRMTILDVSATGDEDVINTDAVNGELSYRVQQMQKLQSQVLDLEDLQGDSISIADFTFNDFKVDLDHLTPTDKEMLQKIIPGFLGVAENKSLDENGVVFCLKHLEENENYIANNPLYPYCLIFVSFDNEIIYNVKQCKNTLDVLRSSCMIGRDSKELKNNFMKNLATKKKQTELQELWKTAIESIKGNADLSVVDSVFQPGETITPLMSADQEFALVNYFVING